VLGTSTLHRLDRARPRGADRRERDRAPVKTSPTKSSWRWRRSHRGVLQLLPSKYVLPVLWLHWSAHRVTAGV